eukprot:gene12911-biopygen16974
MLVGCWLGVGWVLVECWLGVGWVVGCWLSDRCCVHSRLITKASPLPARIRGSTAPQALWWRNPPYLDEHPIFSLSGKPELLKHPPKALWGTAPRPSLLANGCLFGTFGSHREHVADRKY